MSRASPKDITNQTIQTTINLIAQNLSLSPNTVYNNELNLCGPK